MKDLEPKMNFRNRLPEHLLHTTGYIHTEGLTSTYSITRWNGYFELIDSLKSLESGYWFTPTPDYANDAYPKTLEAWNKLTDHQKIRAIQYYMTEGCHSLVLWLLDHEAGKFEITPRSLYLNSN